MERPPALMLLFTLMPLGFVMMAAPGSGLCRGTVPRLAGLMRARRSHSHFFGGAPEARRGASADAGRGQRERSSADRLRSSPLATSPASDAISSDEDPSRSVSVALMSWSSVSRAAASQREAVG